MVALNPKSFLRRKARFLTTTDDNDDDNDNDNDSDNNTRNLRRTESTSSYMQRRRNIYVNMDLPASEYDEKGQPIDRHYVSNRIRTAKYTILSFVPKNLFEQFRNVANLYFLFLVILQCIPLFGVTEPAVSALPLIAILVITGIKDAFEDWKRNQSDQRVNNATTRTLHNWKNVNTPIATRGAFFPLFVFLGFFCALAGVENRFTQCYRLAQLPKQPKNIVFSDGQLDNNDTSPTVAFSSDDSPLPPPPKLIDPVDQPVITEPRRLLTTVRQRSDTLRSELSSMFKPKRQPYRPGNIPHSVLYRTATNDTSNANATQTSLPENPEDQSLFGGRRPSHHNLTRMPTGGGGCVHSNCDTKWKDIRWQDLHVGDYVQIRNDEDVPADVVVLSTSEPDSICYIETQNLDGETNLKVRQGLEGTSDIQTEHDCEQASFYIESEPPHVNIYQYNAVMRWTIDPKDTGTMRSGVSHEKSDAISYNNILLRGCVLRNTEWVIGIVVYTGNDTKIMLNSGQTPSKRSKMAKATNPHVSCLFNFRFSFPLV
jgi:phospholipid-translocating ATPase